MKKVFLTCICIIFCLVSSQCEENNQSPNPQGTNIQLTAISPGEGLSHAPAFVLTANGVNFKADSVILFNGLEQETTFISSAQLCCSIQPDEIIISGLLTSSTGSSMPLFRSEELPVKVRTPSANNHETNSLSFVLNNNHKFNTAFSIYNTSYMSRYPSAVITDNGDIHVIWQDHIQGSYEIYYSSSDSYGGSWNVPHSLSGEGDFRAPDLDTDREGNLNAVFYDNDNNARDIYFCHSTDNGATWSTAKNLSHTLRGSFDPVITSGESGRLYVAWTDDTPGRRSILFSRSADHGNSWDGMRTISNTTIVSNYAAICLDSMENVYLVWFQENLNTFSLFFSRSMDKGDVWTVPLQIASLTTPLCRPDIAVDSNGIVHVVFDDLLGYMQNIYTLRSGDGGTTWEPSMNISYEPGTSEDYWAPVLVLDRADNLNVAWIGSAPRGALLYYCRSIDSGISFGLADTSSDFRGVTDITAIVDTKGDLHVVGGIYIQSENKVKLYYSKSRTTAE